GGGAVAVYRRRPADCCGIESGREGRGATDTRFRVRVVKNRLAPPFRQAEFDIEYGTGISKEGGLLDLALEHDLIQKSGSFFSHGETRLGQGRNNTKEFLRDNPELMAELEAKINDKLGIGKTEEARPEAEKAADKAKAVKAVADAESEPEKAEERKRQARKPQKKAA